jgi:hypothetical protein
MLDGISLVVSLYFLVQIYEVPAQNRLKLV